MTTRKNDWRDKLMLFVDKHSGEGIMLAAFLTALSLSITGILFICLIFKHP